MVYGWYTCGIRVVYDGILWYTLYTLYTLYSNHIPTYTNLYSMSRGMTPV